MVKYSIVARRELCLGCQACEIACKQEHDIPVGPRWMRAITVGPEEVGGKLRLSFHHIRCMHCSEPPCIDACPVDAISKRIDGIVLINEELCIGCDACIEACPFGAPQFGSVFFMITGFHGFHVSVGVIFLLIVARKVWRGDYDNETRGFFTGLKGRYESVEIMGLYWHFVDLVWVFIFAFFYLW